METPEIVARNIINHLGGQFPFKSLRDDIALFCRERAQSQYQTCDICKNKFDTYEQGFNPCDKLYQDLDWISRMPGEIIRGCKECMQKQDDFLEEMHNLQREFERGVKAIRRKWRAACRGK